MYRRRDFQSAAPLWAVLSVAVLWLAALLASGYEDGMTAFDLMGRFSEMLERPFAVRWTPHTLKFMLSALTLYAVGIGLYYSMRENRRPGEEYGSAKWGSVRELNRKYRDAKNKAMNMPLTKNVRIGLDGYKHQRNLNVLVDGGSGTGKTHSYSIPIVASANCSYIITDPKGELLRSTGQLLRDAGYDLKVFDLVHPEQSDCYNPFMYLRSEADVLKMIDNLIRNTTPQKAQTSDPFWEKAEIGLFSALILYLWYFAPPEEQTFGMVLYMLTFCEAREEDEQYQSPVVLLFKALEEENPDHTALKEYKLFKLAAGKTVKSILVSVAMRINSLNISQFNRMTSRDDMDFGSLGERKRAIFCVIPVTDASMNYLVGMLYTQCFQELYTVADDKYNGRLPVHVQAVQDEWANVAQPESYPRILATCRGYNIGLSIIVQNIQQIKSLYEKEWESIIGNCDTLLFLGGGNEPTSMEFFSKLLGKETLDTRTRGLTKGRSGSSSTNYQQTGRELMTPDELRMMDNRYALLFIRGERPVMDQKYDMKRHPNYKKTLRGGAKPYVHHPTPNYALDDLPYQVSSLDDIEFIETEE